MRIPSYDDLTPSIPDVSAQDVFASVKDLLPEAGPVANDTSRRARRACEEAARGMGSPQATEPGCGAEPHAEQDVFASVKDLLPEAGPVANDTSRRARRACEGAARGMGSPQATEPGCGAEPHAEQDVFASVKDLLPEAGPVARGGLDNSGQSTQLFACVRSTRLPEIAVRVAADFSPRLQRYGADAVVLDVSGLGRLLGPPDAIGAEIARAALASFQLAAAGFQLAGSSSPFSAAYGAGGSPAPRSVSRYGLRVEAHPVEHGRVCSDTPAPPSRALEPGRAMAELQRTGIRVSVAPTQMCALLLSLAESSVTIVTANEAAALAPLPLRVLEQFMAAIHGVTILRKKSRAASAPATVRGSMWPAWPACAQGFDVLRRWGVSTLGEFAALPAADLSARMGQTGVALQQLARGRDPRPLVPDPDVPRFVGRMELEWPIDTLEPLSFVLARLLDPLSSALERADRAAAAIRLDLRLVDRTTHARMLQFPVAMRDARVLRTLLLLDLESHPPSAAIDIVEIEIDPAPGRVVQYSLLERAMPSAETLATLTARLGALVGDTRCGTPVLLDTHRPDAFEMRRFDGAAIRTASNAGIRTADRATLLPCIRRFRPPVAVRVTIDRGRPAHIAIDRRGMPGGPVVQAAGPWRSSGGWWTHDAPWNRDEWDVELSDGTICRLFYEAGGWFMDGVMD